eukprot:3170587-Rhodomonas_salina.5
MPGYALATECPVLTQRMVLPDGGVLYIHDIRQVRTQPGIGLRASYAIFSTDIPYATTGITTYATPGTDLPSSGLLPGEFTVLTRCMVLPAPVSTVAGDAIGCGCVFADPGKLSAYALAMLSPVLSYAFAMRSLVLS